MLKRSEAERLIELSWGYEGWHQNSECPGAPTRFRNIAARYYLESHTAIEVPTGLRDKWTEQERKCWALALREIADALETEPEAESAASPSAAKSAEIPD
jgi:hypothetical protein